jgi:hypothetical protein
LGWTIFNSNHSAHCIIQLILLPQYFCSQPIAQPPFPWSSFRINYSHRHECLCILASFSNLHFIRSSLSLLLLIFERLVLIILDLSFCLQRHLIATLKNLVDHHCLKNRLRSTLIHLNCRFRFLINLLRLKIMDPFPIFSYFHLSRVFLSFSAVFLLLLNSFAKLVPTFIISSEPNCWTLDQKTFYPEILYSWVSFSTY